MLPYIPKKRESIFDNYIEIDHESLAQIFNHNMNQNDNSIGLLAELEKFIIEEPSTIPQNTNFYSSVENTENFSISYMCDECNEFPIIFFFDENNIEIKCCKIRILKIGDYLNSLNKIFIQNKKCREGNTLKSYCFDCKKNICEICKINEHNGHKIKDLEAIKKEDDIEELKKEIERIRGEEKIEMNSHILKYTKDEIIKQNRQIPENMIFDYKDFEKVEDLTNPNKDEELSPEYNYLIDIILNHINKCEPNYSHFSNIKNIYIFLKIRKKNKLFIEYKNTNKKGKNRIIRIFGENFVKNNKNNCDMVFNQKIEDIKDIINIDQDDPTLRVILVENNNVTNMSELFSSCLNLVKIYKESEWKTSNVTNMSKMFKNCKSLKSFPEIKGWDISNVLNLDEMFNGCYSLKGLEKLSNWNTKNVTDMKSLFENCRALEAIEGISNWLISNVIDINGMFCNCINLKYLPDISHWNTQNIMFIQKILLSMHHVTWL
jgi:surface protein